MRKILLITVRSDYGGGPQHILTLLKGLKGKFIFYIACPFEKPYIDYFQSYATCINIPHRKFSLIRLIVLWKTVYLNKIDVIHSHGKGAGLYTRLLGILTQKPVVHSFHGFHYKHLAPIKKFSYLLYERLFARFTKLFINVTKSEQDECITAKIFKKESSIIISNAVEMPPPLSNVRENIYFNIISVSRLAPEKGLDILLDVINLLTEKTKKIKVMLVGDGPSRDSLLNRVAVLNLQKYVLFLGFRDDIPNLLRDSDLYLSTSRGEAQGISIMEAMAHSLPSVATDVIGHIDIVKNEYNGFLFNISSPGEGADIIYKLIKDRHLREKIARNAYAYAKENFSIEVMSASLEKIYTSL
ncbi:hypothetical protein KN63_01795 [Smithella sp. F21]|nr:hypothetical protein KN63_01795 [Smithella sp. F21]